MFLRFLAANVQLYVQGGSKARAETASRIVEGGIAVMGHIGLTPQAISVIGGFRAQGRTAVRARQLVDEALRLQDAGCFSIVLECVPDNVAQAVTETLEIPTIGIGAGQYGWIQNYNPATFTATVYKESTNQPGWDNIVPGKLNVTALTATTVYFYEPRVSVSSPTFSKTNTSVQTGALDGSKLRSPLNMAKTPAIKQYLIANGAIK